MDIETISEKYPELFHYTTGTGLTGIVTSGTLWTTHIAFLNDYEEYKLFFRHRLPRILSEAVEVAFEKVKTHPHVTFDVRRAGGERAYKDQKAKTLLPHFAKWTSDLNSPYVASFCASKIALVSAHGLLSQWRGYGTDGGYALVFDTNGLNELLTEQARKIKGMEFFMGDVEYYDDPENDDGLHPETKEQTKDVMQSIADFLLSGDSGHLGAIFTPIHRMASTTKHWGFREENEIRLVLSQPHPMLVSALPDEHVLKPVNHFMRNGLPVPYMALFDDHDNPVRGRLPLRRILVGPHRDSEARKLAVTLLLQRWGYDDVLVTTSEIPYRG